MVGTRYDNKPFLRLLDAYVLRAIGKLEPEHEQAIAAMEPKLQEVYQTQGSWPQIVASQMEFADDFPDTIRAAWRRATSVAAERVGAADPIAFAHAFVDSQLSN